MTRHPGDRAEASRESTLRPLRSVASTVSALRGGSLSPDEQRSAVIQIASAVEMTLRRLLRDDPGAPLEVRLSALAPDEIEADEIVSHLRRSDRISIELAAGVHDLLRARSRVRDTGELQPDEDRLAHRVADRLEAEVVRGPAPSSVPPPSVDPFEEETEVAPVAPPGRRRSIGWLLSAAGLVILLVGLGVWWLSPGQPDHMETGLALFAEGAYADAASHFFRQAQQNPEDPLPHLYLARIHRRMNRADLAGPELKTALELAPRDPAVHTELGFLYADMGNDELAIERFRAAIELDPETEAAWVGLVRSLRAAGRQDAAERIVQQAPPAVRALLAGAGTPGDS